MDLIENQFNHLYQIKQANSISCQINSEIFEQSLIVSNDQLVADLDLHCITQLTANHIELIVKMQPEILLVATGKQIKYPDHNLLEPLLKRHIGIEIMNNASAARTYNVLLAEERKVVCLMILEKTNN